MTQSTGEAHAAADQVHEEETERHTSGKIWSPALEYDLNIRTPRNFLLFSWNFSAFHIIMVNIPKQNLVISGRQSS